MNYIIAAQSADVTSFLQDLRDELRPVQCAMARMIRSLYKL